MRKYFRSLADVLASPIVAAANALRRDKAARQDRVLQSTKLEDMIYQGLHKDDDELIALEQSCTEKLSTFSALSRDIYQSFYSLRVRKREEESLSAPSRRFNVPILKELMDGDSYPTIKAACEGRQIPAYEAAGEFISQVADNLDSLMEQAGGQKNALETLEHLEEKRDQSMERLQKLIEQMEQSGATPALETQLIKAANTAQSQSNQVEAVGRIVQENLQKHGGELTLLVKQASEAAAQTAIDVQLTLMSWGTGPDNSDPKSIAADTELVHRVQQNDTLMKVARYLGRLKELMEGKRKNGYAYGRGEKYTLELGADLSRALASEFVLLALPETTPLFLRKLQKKGLKQYQRREAIRKGSGDIICMLDESDSAEEAAPWCKAVALALLDIAMRDQRRFAMIHFSGKGHFKTEMVFDETDFDNHDGLFAVPREEWEASPDFDDAIQNRLREEEQQRREAAFLDHQGDCFALYQLHRGPELRDLRDISLERLRAEGASPRKGNYDLVYTAPLTGQGDTLQQLDQLWHRFKEDHPADYHSPSMSISDIVVLKQGGVLSCHYVDQYAFSELPGFFSGRNPLRAAEDSLEQNDNQLDGILNNTPSVAELEAQVKAGQQVSLVDLAQAVHKEQTEKKKSVVAQLRTAPPAQEQRKKQRKKAQKGSDNHEALYL